MSISTTMAHAALASLRTALGQVNRMLVDTNTIQWEIVKAIESIEDWLEEQHE